MLDITVEEFETHVVCRPAGELDAFTVGALRECLESLVAVPRLVLDLSEVPFLDSAGMGALVASIRSAKDQGNKVAVAAARDNVVRLLHTAGFERIVPVTETIADALSALDPVDSEEE